MLRRLKYSLLNELCSVSILHECRTVFGTTVKNIKHRQHQKIGIPIYTFYLFFCENLQAEVLSFLSRSVLVVTRKQMLRNGQMLTVIKNKVNPSSLFFALVGFLSINF